MQINYLVLCNCKISFLLRKKIMSYYQLPDELNYDTPKIQLHVPSDEKGTFTIFGSNQQSDISK